MIDEIKKGTKIRFKSKKKILAYYEKYIKLPNVDKYIFKIESCISDNYNGSKSYSIINDEVNKLLNRNYIFGDDIDFIVLEEK